MHLNLIRQSLQEALKSPYVPTAFCVGALIASADLSETLSTGFSREFPQGVEGELHAEHCALAKLQDRLGPQEAAAKLHGAVLYTTMEPCSVRTSGSRPCADRIIEAQLGTVYLGVSEPTDFVVCEGVQKLRNAGIKVVKVLGLEEQCLDVARGKKEGVHL